jgi:hypothetical protein
MSQPTTEITKVGNTVTVSTNFLVMGHTLNSVKLADNDSLSLPYGPGDDDLPMHPVRIGDGGIGEN